MNRSGAVPVDELTNGSGGDEGRGKGTGRVESTPSNRLTSVLDEFSDPRGEKTSSGARGKEIKDVRKVEAFENRLVLMRGGETFGLVFFISS